MANRRRITITFSAPKIRLRALVHNRIAALVAIVAMNLLSMSAPIVANAVHDAGCTVTQTALCLFELDGNPTHLSATTPPYACSALFDSSGTQKTIATANPPLSRVFIAGGANGSHPTYVQGSADGKDLSANVCNLHTVPAKDQLFNAYGALFQVPNTTGLIDKGDQIVYLGLDRGTPNGDANAGFWLDQDPTATCDTGHHVNGDIFLLSTFTTGGGLSTLQAYTWSGGASGMLTGPTTTGTLCGSLADDPFCGIANTTTVNTPWTPGNTGLAAPDFLEVGIDLSKLFKVSLPTSPLPCFSTFLAETRSSQSLSAELKDVLSGQFSTCKQPTIATTIKPSSTITIGSSVTDSATLSGGGASPGGTVDYHGFNA